MKKYKTNLFIILGLLLLAAALVLTVCILFEENRAEKLSISAVAELIELIESQGESKDNTANPNETPEYILNPDMKMPVKKINGMDYIGVLRVPALNLKLPVLNKWSYDNLTVSPCRYIGSVYLNNLIIAAHNYRSHFAYLRELQQGDSVSFTDMNCNRFNYEVVETEILLPEQVDEMKSGDWDLTLFTCTFGGEYRITVRCKLVNS